MHAGAFETGPDGDFASGFEDAGRGAEALPVELRIAHAVAIAIDVKSAPGSIVAVCGIRTESRDNGAQFAVVQFRATGCCPLFGLFG